MWCLEMYVVLPMGGETEIMCFKRKREAEQARRDFLNQKIPGESSRWCSTPRLAYDMPAGILIKED